MSEPTAGAMRAAKAFYEGLWMSSSAIGLPVKPLIRELATMFDRESGLRELVEAAKASIGSHGLGHAQWCDRYRLSGSNCHCSLGMLRIALARVQP